MSKAADEHRSRGAGMIARCAVLTVSDSRTLEVDASGDLIQQRLEDGGHEVVVRELVADQPGDVRQRIESWLEPADLDLVLTTGGTGVAPQDHTIEAVRPLWQRDLPGFGELFRWLSFQQIGAAAMLSRAAAGIRGETAIFVLPGSPRAVELAMDQLILPEVQHLLGLLRS